jgi:hemerythrin superfamily protein
MQAPPSHAAGIHTALLASATAGRPLTGVFATLVDQHREVLELLRHAGTAPDATRRQERWVEARRRLLSHERAEASVVYAALEGFDAVDTFLQQHTQQALELETAVQDLDASDAESDLWIERLRDVLALLDDHVRDEETDFFQRAQRLLGENTARDLDDRFASAQRDILHSLG